MAERTLVTCALPYANGPVHLGHIAGVYLPGDIYVKYLRLKGEECLFVCGTDEHGVPITISADQEGLTPPEIVARYHKLQDEAFKGLGIEFDIFSGTSTCPHHKAISQEFFQNLLRAGHVEERVTAQYFCTRCNRFLPDRYVEGQCPYCDSPDARGDQCEACGKALDSLKKPRCKVCGRRPEQRMTNHWFFRLDKYEERLKAWLGSKTAWKENVRPFALGIVEGGLKPRSITRDITWGVPVPAAGGEGKVLYVWFDAPIGYISFTRELGERRGDPGLWKKWWRDEQTRLVHFIGKDNIVFHAVIWPAMLMGQQDKYVLPAEIPAFEFLNFKGSKASKSRGNMVPLHEFLQRYPADFGRYYLTAIAPETRDANWAWDDFVTRVNADLADILGNFVNRAFAFAHRFMGGRTPAASAADLAEPLQAVQAAKKALDGSLSSFQFREAFRAFLDLAREGNRYFDKREPWVRKDGDPAHAAATVRASLEMAAGLSVLGWPFLPNSLSKVRGWLGRPGRPGPEDWNRLGAPFLETGAPLGSPEILFQKLDLKAVLEKEEPACEAAEAAGAKPAGEGAPCAGAKKLPFERFQELDLRVAVVLSAEKVPGASKLLKLGVDLGTEQRTIVAGIAKAYPDPASLVGKRIVLVANLEPAVIRGVESNGMLLAAVDGATVSLLLPDTDVPPGTRIS